MGFLVASAPSWRKEVLFFGMKLQMDGNIPIYIKPHYLRRRIIKFSSLSNLYQDEMRCGSRAEGM